jgi:hypothetical protein
VNTGELLDRIAENVSVRRSFGAAYERGGLLVIPVAFVLGGGGGGEGPMKPAATGPTDGTGTTGPVPGGPPEGPPPTSTGGGFGGLVLPMGVYVVKDDHVGWVPAYDTTLIVLAALGVVRAFVGLFKNGRRRHRA